MCVMDKFCGADLRTGSFIIGYLNLVLNSVFIILLSVSWHNLAAMVPKDKDEEFLKSFAVIIVIISLVVYVIYFFFNILLLIGTHKKIRGCIRAYLIYTAIFMAILILQVYSSFRSGVPIYYIIARIAYIIFLCFSASVAKNYIEKGEFENNFASCPKA